MKFESFENLEVWKLSRELKLEIKEVIEKFPAGEKYLLRNQLIRCSRSIGANIAEGFGRFHYKENIRFCLNARGSLMETLNHLIDAHDEKYISQQELNLLKT